MTFLLFLLLNCGCKTHQLWRRSYFSSLTLLRDEKSENMDGGFFSLKHQEKGKNLFAHMCMWSYVHLQWLGESVTQFFKYWMFSICMHLPNKTYRITQNTLTWVLYFFMSVLLKKCE